MATPEYQRRIDRNLARGRTLSQARGHPRAGEQHISAKAAIRKRDPKLLDAIKALRATGSLTNAARREGVSAERVRRFASELDFVERRGRRYVVGDDRWPRRVAFYADRRRVVTEVEGYERARLIGLYQDAIGNFWRSNDLGHVAPYVGVQVTDIRGKTYTLETRPNVLYRLAAQGGDSFEHVYRVIV
jgi:hypothetical protein